MAYVFLGFAHLEALSGIAALGSMAIYLTFAGQNYQILPARLLAVCAGLAMYVLIAWLGVGADAFLRIVARETSIIVSLALLGLTVLEGIAAAACVVAALQGEDQRKFAVGVCTFAAVSYIHGYIHIWMAGMTSQVVPLLHFVVFTGAAVVTGVLLLYLRSAK